MPEVNIFEEKSSLDNLLDSFPELPVDDEKAFEAFVSDSNF